MTTERFKQINLPADIIDMKTSKIYHTTTGNDGYELCILLNELHEENEQLKQRNNRQAKQLDRLYNLIEQKDWRTLTDILDDFKRCEEQLQREWRTYK